MQLDIDTLEALRRQHPAWRLLAAESCALVVLGGTRILRERLICINRRTFNGCMLASTNIDSQCERRRYEKDPAVPGSNDAIIANKNYSH